MEDKPTDEPSQEPQGWKKQRRFTFSDVVMNAVEPGVNQSILLFINVVFLLLLLTLVLIIQFSTGYKTYMVILVFLAFGLLLAFNWLVISLFVVDSQ